MHAKCQTFIEGALANRNTSSSSSSMYSRVGNWNP